MDAIIYIKPKSLHEDCVNKEVGYSLALARKFAKELRLKVTNEYVDNHEETPLSEGLKNYMDLFPAKYVIMLSPYQAGGSNDVIGSLFLKLLAIGSNLIFVNHEEMPQWNR